ncbi:MAG: hypothetical protein ABIT01_02950 [Thermoanaerobaculia bacterium]
MLLFPQLRRAIRRKSRALLLLYVFFVLSFGLFTWVNSAPDSSPSGWRGALTLLGVAALVVAFASVLRDALRDT